MTDLLPYACSKCGATDCKLWREYMSFLPVDLLCAPCAAGNQGESISDIDADGRRTRSFGGKSDQIGGLVPAVPTPERDSYWGYTSVPQDGVLWWRALPTLPKEAI